MSRCTLLPLIGCGVIALVLVIRMTMLGVKLRRHVIPGLRQQWGPSLTDAFDDKWFDGEAGDLVHEAAFVRAALFAMPVVAFVVVVVTGVACG